MSHVHRTRRLMHQVDAFQTPSLSEILHSRTNFTQHQNKRKNAQQQQAVRTVRSTRCSKCSNAHYCSPDHQRQDQRSHKRTCRSTPAPAQAVIASPVAVVRDAQAPAQAAPRPPSVPLLLYYGGSAVPNPGVGGWGAIVYAGSEPRLDTMMIREGGVLGHHECTSNTAEYMSLIQGMRRLLRDLVVVPATSVSLTRMQAVAAGLGAKFGQVKYEFVGREENPFTHSLARRVAKSGKKPLTAMPGVNFIPNTVHVLPVEVQGKAKAMATHDLTRDNKTPAGYSLIDAWYLQEMVKKDTWQDTFKSLKDPSPIASVPIQVSNNKTLELGVLGLLPSLEVTIEIPGPRTKVTLTLTNLLVVDKLPVPLHLALSTHERKLTGLAPMLGQPFERKQFEMGRQPADEDYPKLVYWDLVPKPRRETPTTSSRTETQGSRTGSSGSRRQKKRPQQPELVRGYAL
ncbi:hypothetical protein HDU96_001463 [Phlyctochytrium bullatum]|nr:hypothetical protein HDU96_001463 [Phlyctochytrium bullatum]